MVTEHANFSLQRFIEFTAYGHSIMLEESTMRAAGYSVFDGGNIHDTEVYKQILFTLSTFKDDDVYIDVGASIGDTSLWTQKGICYAFEPGKKQYEQLLFNMKYNPKARVVPINRACYSSPVPYKPVVSAQHQGLDTITDCPNSNTRAIVLDEMFKEIPNIKLIKIDVEGTDMEVLKGAKNIIMKHRPTIIIEIIHFDKMEALNFFNNIGYNFQLVNISCIAQPKEGVK